MAEELYIEKRIENLEKQVAELTKVLASMKREIVLSNDDDGTKITLSAIGKDTAGIWISGKPGEPMIAIYKMNDQAAIGMYREANEDGKRSGGLDIALSANKDYGYVQLIDKDNKVYFLEPNEAGEGVQLNHRSTF